MQGLRIWCATLSASSLISTAWWCRERYPRGRARGIRPDGGWSLSGSLLGGVLASVYGIKEGFLIIAFLLLVGNGRGITAGMEKKRKMKIRRMGTLRIVPMLGSGDCKRIRNGGPYYYLRCCHKNLKVPDENGNMDDLVLGQDALEEYRRNPSCSGCYRPGWRTGSRAVIHHVNGRGY